MKRLPLLLIFAFWANCFPLQAQLLTGRFVTSVYGWMRHDTPVDSTNHLRGYENIELHFGTGNISLHTSMQGSTDLSEKMDNDPQLRLYNAYLSVKNIADMVDVKIGRQAVFAGVNYGSIDGGLLRVRPSDGIEAVMYGGGLTPPSQRTDFFTHFDNNWQIGAQALLYLVDYTTVSLSYMNRHRETTPYQGFRFDDQLGTIQPTAIDYGSRANQYGSINAMYSRDSWWLNARYDYDFNFERTSRAELTANYEASRDLGLSLELAHREPTFAYNSYFAILEAEANEEAEFGVTYRLNPSVTLIGRFSGVVYEDDHAYRVTVGASNKYASLSYTRDMSFDGSLDGVNVQAAYPFMEGKLVPHVGVYYSSYALADNLDKSTTFSGMIGTTYRPVKIVSFDIQGQYVTNKIYKSDMRGFARVNYWFSELFGSGK